MVEKNLGKSWNRPLLHKIFFLPSIPNLVLVREQIYQEKKKYISNNKQVTQNANVFRQDGTEECMPRKLYQHFRVKPLQKKEILLNIKIYINHSKIIRF